MSEIIFQKKIKDMEQLSQLIDESINDD